MTTTTAAALSIIRVSNDTSDETTQRTSCADAAKREDLTLVREIPLHAVSGFKGDKRHLAAMADALAAVRSGEVSAVVVAHSSRLARLPHRDVARWVWDLEDAGGRIVSHDEQSWATGSTPMDDGWALMTAGNNHQSSKNTSYHVNRRFKVMDEAGYHRGWGLAGYEILCTICGAVKCTEHKGHKRLVMHPVAAEAVIQAFADSAAGMSTPVIARRFKGINERCGTKLPASADGVSNMLNMNEYSTGHHREGIACQCKFPPLVSPAQQTATLAALNARRTGNAVSTRAIGKDDYSGALRCAVCDAHGRMYRKFANHAKERRYTCKTCGKGVLADRADAALEAQMSADTAPWYVPYTTDPNAGRDRALEAVQLALAELPSLGLDEDEEDEHRAVLRAERKRLQAIEDMPATTYATRKTDDSGRELTEGDRWQMMTPAERRDTLTAGSVFAYARNTGDRSGDVVVSIERERNQD